MFRLHFKTLLPAIIFALCILEMSFGVSVAFYVVWWFYLYFALNAKVLLKTPINSLSYILDRGILSLYFINVALFLLQHFSSAELFETTTAEAYNILWWTIFALILTRQIQLGSVDYTLFWKYLSALVFAGAVLAALLGIIKYRNILSGNALLSYYYNDVLLPGSSLNVDYNIYSLGLIIAVLLSLNLRSSFKGLFKKLLYILLNAIIFGSILLSGSRRAVLMVVAVILISVFYTRLKKLKSQLSLGKVLILPIVVLVFLAQYSEPDLASFEESEFIDQSIARVFTLKDQLTGENERTVRFDWALSKLQNASSLELIFGQGFGYLKKMGTLFSEQKEDNPHNFFLASFIYGGIIGGILVILLISRGLYLSFYLDKTIYFMFLLIVFFGLTSSNTLFSYRVFPIILFLLALQPVRRSNGMLNPSNQDFN